MNKGWTVDSAKRFFEQKSKSNIWVGKDLRSDAIFVYIAKFNVEEKPEPKKLREVLHDIDFGGCGDILK